MINSKIQQEICCIFYINKSFCKNYKIVNLEKLNIGTPQLGTIKLLFIKYCAVGSVFVLGVSLLGLFVFLISKPFLSGIHTMLGDVFSFVNFFANFVKP